MVAPYARLTLLLRRFAEAVDGRAGPAAAAARRLVLDRVVVALRGGADQVGRAARHAAVEGIGDVDQRLVDQVVLPAQRDHAQRAVQSDIGLAAEQLAVLVGGAGIVEDARLQRVHRRRAAAQFLAP